MIRAQFSKVGGLSSLHYVFDGRALWASVEELEGDLWIATGRFR